MAKIALLSYHSKINELYPQRWIEKYLVSVKTQTFKDFQIFEMNYGGGDERIFGNSYFESFPYPTFVHALNYLLDKVFSAGYDVVFNSNVDDYFSHLWMERLLADVNRGYDLVSCNFCLLKDEKIFKYHKFQNLDIATELERGHNIICHPAVAYTANFWQHNRYDSDQIPYEDLELWKRALRSGSQFFINEQNLLFHRIHNNSVCLSSNR